MYFAVGSDMHTRTVHAVTAPIKGPLNDAEQNCNFQVSGGLAHGVQMTRLNLNGLVQIMGMEFFLLSGIKLCAVCMFNPKRVARHKGLAKGDKSAALLCGPRHPLHHFMKRLSAIHPNGRNLSKADRQQFGVG